MSEWEFFCEWSWGLARGAGYLFGWTLTLLLAMFFLSFAARPLLKIWGKKIPWFS